jgi:predicted RNase H-like HicB family nuclease
MERIINLHIEKLPEGYYLATSDDIQGLVAQGRTIAETMEIARDVARRLLEAQKERKGSMKPGRVKNNFDLQLVVSS